MAQKYMLVPLAKGLFAGYDLCTRAVIGALYDRHKLSSYNHIGSTGGAAWYDEREQAVYCVYSQAELAEQIGVSERTVRRSLDRLKDDQLIWWRKAAYKGANRYYLHEYTIRQLREK